MRGSGRCGVDGDTSATCATTGAAPEGGSGACASTVAPAGSEASAPCGSVFPECSGVPEVVGPPAADSSADGAPAVLGTDEPSADDSDEGDPDDVASPDRGVDSPEGWTSLIRAPRTKRAHAEVAPPNPSPPSVRGQAFNRDPSRVSFVLPTSPVRDVIRTAAFRRHPLPDRVGAAERAGACSTWNSRRHHDSTLARKPWTEASCPRRNWMDGTGNRTKSRGAEEPCAPLEPRCQDPTASTMACLVRVTKRSSSGLRLSSTRILPGSPGWFTLAVPEGTSAHSGRRSMVSGLSYDQLADPTGRCST